MKVTTSVQLYPAPKGAAADLDILDRHADELNLAAEDILAYQVIPCGPARASMPRLRWKRKAG